MYHSPVWKKKVPLSVLAGLAGSVAIAIVFVGLISPECPPSLAGDYELSLGGMASEPDWVGFEVDGRLFSVDVETGETAEQIGPRLTELMKAAGLVVDCERYDGERYDRYDGERYSFILRDIGGMPELETVLGIGAGSSGPILRDRPEYIVSVARAFFMLLNANDVAGMRDNITREFFHEQVSDLMASMAASGERVVIESMEEPTIECYQATIGLELVWEVGTEQQHVDGYLTLSKHHYWLVSGGVIR